MANDTTRKPQPFRFSTTLNLTLLTNRRAHDLAELLEHLRAVPGSVIYYHTPTSSCSISISLPSHPMTSRTG